MRKRIFLHMRTRGTLWSESLRKSGRGTFQLCRELGLYLLKSAVKKLKDSHMESVAVTLLELKCESYLTSPMGNKARHRAVHGGRGDY